MNTPRAETVLQGLRQQAEATPQHGPTWPGCVSSQDRLPGATCLPLSYYQDTLSEQSYHQTIQGGHVTEQLWS